MILKRTAVLDDIAARTDYLCIRFGVAKAWDQSIKARSVCRLFAATCCWTKPHRKATAWTMSWHVGYNPMSVDSTWNFVLPCALDSMERQSMYGVLFIPRSGTFLVAISTLPISTK
jgi:hypothetical protein